MYTSYLELIHLSLDIHSLKELEPIFASYYDLEAQPYQYFLEIAQAIFKPTITTLWIKLEA